MSKSTMVLRDPHQDTTEKTKIVVHASAKTTPRGSIRELSKDMQIS